MRPPLGHLGLQLLDDVSGDAGETHVEALELRGEPVVVDAQQGEHGGVQVVDADGVLVGAVAELAGGVPGDPGLHASAGREDAEGEDVLPARPLPWPVGVRPNSPPQRTRVSQAPPGKDFEEGGGGPVNLGGARRAPRGVRPRSGRPRRQRACTSAARMMAAPGCRGR